MQDKRPDGSGASAGDAAPAPTDTPLVLTLRDVALPPAPAAPAAPIDDGLIVSDPDARAAPYLGDPEADKAAERAARRAQVRRDRVRDDSPAPAPAAGPKVLVLDGEPASCGELCEQLQAFGFELVVASVPPPLPAPWPFVAVFVSAAAKEPDGGDAIDLCHRVRESSRLPGTTKPVLVLAAPELSATDRVRAGLAGVNELVIGAVTRGSVAKVLDARGVALPSDARRG
ncbi:MAG: response regulator transcription factor [Burkholderiaceae bacterium]|nr:response regulator transcription factor [Burkholderiaceae bacterium]